MSRIIYLNTQPWCTCAQRGVQKKQDGFTLDRSSKFWVCTRCRKPSRMNYNRVVLGLEQIPQARRLTDDVYMLEKLLDARKVILAELGRWERIREDDGGWDWDRLDDE